MKNYLFIVGIFLVFSSYAQQQEFNRGLNFNDQAYKNTPQKATLTRAMYNLPTSFSLKAYCPIPKSQGNYGTCVGWSTNYAAMTISEAIANNITDKQQITDNVFSPGFVYYHIKSASDANCKYGSWINDAFDLMKTKGTVRMKDFDISCATSIPAELYSKAAQNKITDYAKLFDNNDQDGIKVQAVKKSLSEKKPVVIGIICPPSFNYVSGAWNPTESIYGNYGGHAMCVIGYDDNQYGGAFEVQNSWGTTWGNEGYVWIKYTDFASYVRYAYELIGIQQTNPQKKIDLSGSVRYALSDGTPMNATFTNNSYLMQNAYKVGTKFRIYINNLQPAYVYAFGSDRTNKAFQIFPYNSFISPVLDYSNNEIAIPDEAHYIELDETIGKNYLCVLYSKKELNFAQLMKTFEAQVGTFKEKVQKTVGTDLLEFNKVEYLKDNQIGFKARSDSKNIVALIVEIQSTK